MTVCGTQHVKCYSYHAGTSVTVSSGGRSACAETIYVMFNTEQTPINTCMDANMQLTINSFRPLFPDKIFFPDISLTAVKFPDISRFSTFS